MLFIDELAPEFSLQASQRFQMVAYEDTIYTFKTFASFCRYADLHRALDWSKTSVFNGGDGAMVPPVGVMLI